MNAAKPDKAAILNEVVKTVSHAHFDIFHAYELEVSS